jgi:hypothetical protein
LGTVILIPDLPGVFSGWYNVFAMNLILGEKDINLFEDFCYDADHGIP